MKQTRYRKQALSSPCFHFALHNNSLNSLCLLGKKKKKNNIRERPIHIKKNAHNVLLYTYMGLQLVNKKKKNTEKT